MLLFRNYEIITFDPYQTIPSFRDNDDGFWKRHEKEE